MDVIRPVILPVPASVWRLSGKEKNAFLSVLARRAVALSATKSGAFIDRFDKDDQGAPLSCSGVFWSLSHKETYVAGVVATGPVGIDVERVKPCADALFRKTGTDAEWQLAGRPERRGLTFFRYWTAKEAVLKTSGAGFREFSDCRVCRVISDRLLLVRYRDQDWLVDQIVFDGHVASVTRTGWRVEWGWGHGEK